jgi:tRNA-Thr(GGU) m(6)t(6)A37 methyltransferase TsaA
MRISSSKLASAELRQKYGSRNLGQQPQTFQVFPIGYVRSALKVRHGAPRQGWETATEAEIDILPEYAKALEGLEAGQDVWILSWLHQADRTVRKVQPRDEMHKPKLGVFATRAPDRPNPIGLHRAKVLRVSDRAFRIAGFEAIDGTPVLDVKPVLHQEEAF